jgi:hypothetical protein
MCLPMHQRTDGMQSVCSSPGDTVPANCPMSACPMTGPTVLPVQPPQLPPPGASVCSQQSKGAAFVIRELSGLADGPPEAVAYGSCTGVNRRKCEIVHRRPELAVLNFRSFTYPYLQSPGQKPGFAFQPGCRLSGRSLTGVHSGNERGCNLISSSECTKSAIA